MNEFNDSVSLEKTNRNNNIFKYILCFILFFAGGVILGIFGTKKYLENKNSITETPEGVVTDITDITESSEYKDTINELYSLMSTSVDFYSTKGFDIEKMTNDDKLKFIYNYLISKEIVSEVTINSLYYGSLNCNYNFVVDPVKAGSYVSTACSVYSIPTTTIVENYKKLFGNESIDVSLNFAPSSTKSCLIENGTYVCGNIASQSLVSGALNSKFEIVKVTLDKDGTIIIYDKGYLVDTRSTIMNPNDGHDNFTEYYYELRSADNLTFKYTYKKGDDSNYYYLNTVMEQKK